MTSVDARSGPPGGSHGDGRQARRGQARKAVTAEVDKRGAAEARVVFSAASLMMASSALRINFSALAPLVAESLDLSVLQLSHVHTAFLAGYLLGHLPAGYLADKYGGLRMLAFAAFAWSMVSAAHIFLDACTAQTVVPTLVLLRFLVGVSSAAAVPSLGAALAQSLPVHARARAMSTCYGCFNIGQVVGLVAAPLLATRLPWSQAISISGLVCVVHALVCIAFNKLHDFTSDPRLSRLGDGDGDAESPAARPSQRPHASEADQPLLATATAQDPGGAASAAAVPLRSGGGDGGHSGGDESAGRAAAAAPGEARLRWGPDLAVLIWAHSAIGWGFFTLQNWIPMYLKTLDIAHPIVRAGYSALPWAASALLSFVFGALFEAARRRGTGLFRLQTLAHTVATLGATAFMGVLGLVAGPGPALSLTCMGGVLALQTCNYSGFHAYVQVFGASKAGAILGITNSMGAVMGMVANVVLGWSVTATGSFQFMFAISALVYGSSWVLWLLVLRGLPLYESGVGQAHKD